MSIIIINNNNDKKKKRNDKCNWVTELNLKESYNQRLSPFCL